MLHDETCLALGGLGIAVVERAAHKTNMVPAGFGIQEALFLLPLICSDIFACPTALDGAFRSGFLIPRYQIDLFAECSLESSR